MGIISYFPVTGAEICARADSDGRIKSLTILLLYRTPPQHFRSTMKRSRTVGARQALLVVKRWLPAQRFTQLAVVEVQWFEPRLEPVWDQNAWHLGGTPE